MAAPEAAPVAAAVGAVKAEEAAPAPPEPKGSEDVWKEGVPLPNIYFQPTLVDLLIPIMATNFEKYPDMGDIPPKIREHIVAQLPLDLPLELVSYVRWLEFAVQNTPFKQDFNSEFLVRRPFLKLTNFVINAFISCGKNGGPSADVHQEHIEVIVDR